MATDSNTYAWFTYRFRALYETARRGLGDEVTVKLLDNYLLSVAEGWK